MKCSQLLFGTVSLGVAVLVYQTVAYYDQLAAILPHNLTVGERQPNDKLLFNTTVKQGRLVFNSSVKGDKIDYIVSDFIRWPSNDSHFLNYSLTRLEVRERGDGGYVNLYEGGPGYPYVELYFESKFYKGFEFQVTIYGHLDNRTTALPAN